MDINIYISEEMLCQKCGEGFIVPLFDSDQAGNNAVVGWACTSCDLSVTMANGKIVRTASKATPKD